MERKIINLTQHTATPDQRISGVVDHPEREKLQKLLTFDEIPSPEEITDRAEKIAKMASGYREAMIGGAPFLMSALEWELFKVTCVPLYAFSKRVVNEVVDNNGNVQKVSEFRHRGFVEAGV